MDEENPQGKLKAVLKPMWFISYILIFSGFWPLISGFLKDDFELIIMGIFFVAIGGYQIMNNFLLTRVLRV